MAFVVIWDPDLLIRMTILYPENQGSKSKKSVNQGSESDHLVNQGLNPTIRKTRVRI